MMLNRILLLNYLVNFFSCLNKIFSCFLYSLSSVMHYCKNYIVRHKNNTMFVLLYLIKVNTNNWSIYTFFHTWKWKFKSATIFSKFNRKQLYWSTFFLEIDWSNFFFHIVKLIINTSFGRKENLKLL